MQLAKKNKVSWCLPNAGFTLLECIIALAVISLICLSFNWWLLLEKRLNHHQLHSALEWHLCLIQLEQSAEHWSFLEVRDNQLLFADLADNNSNNVIKIEYYRQQLRKVKRGGHEPILLNIETVNFQETGEGVLVKVRSLDGKTYEALFPKWHRT